MITTLGMNPAIDRTLTVHGFEVGGTNRVAASRDEGAGKAVNVALALRALGAQARCVGLLPEIGGELIEGRLADAGVETAFVKTPGAVRVNMKLVDKSSGVVTELNQGGAFADSVRLDELAALCARLFSGGCGCGSDASNGPDASNGEDDANGADDPGAGFLVMTGSLPPGVDPGFYGALASRLGVGCRVALDAEGEPFRQALSAKPHLVKPNRHELELALDRRLPTLPEVIQGARTLISQGIDLALVTLGADGMLLVSHNDTLFAPALKLTITSTVGAGDSALAGALAALEKGLPMEDVLRSAAAAAAASVIRRGGAMLDRSDYMDCRNKIEIQRL